MAKQGRRFGKISEVEASTGPRVAARAICPMCGKQQTVNYRFCSNCGAPAGQAAVGYLHGKSYVGSLVLCVILTLFFIVPGIIATAIYYGDAVRNEKLVGHPLPGANGLRILSYAQAALILVPIILLLASAIIETLNTPG